MEQEEYNAWNKKFYEASISLEDRDKNLEKVAAQIEKVWMIRTECELEAEVVFRVRATMLIVLLCWFVWFVD